MYNVVCMCAVQLFCGRARLLVLGVGRGVCVCMYTYIVRIEYVAFYTILAIGIRFFMLSAGGMEQNGIVFIIVYYYSREMVI